MIKAGSDESAFCVLYLCLELYSWFFYPDYLRLLNPFLRMSSNSSAVKQSHYRWVINVRDAMPDFIKFQALYRMAHILRCSGVSKKLPIFFLFHAYSVNVAFLQNSQSFLIILSQNFLCLLEVILLM